MSVPVKLIFYVYTPSLRIIIYKLFITAPLPTPISKTLYKSLIFEIVFLDSKFKASINRYVSSFGSYTFLYSDDFMQLRSHKNASPYKSCL